MADRRMFAKAVINSGRFLRLSQTARLLYYDLGMFTDDDGVVEAFTVIRLTGATEDDLEALVSTGFVTVLNDDLVCYIQDFGINNSIRNDRYHKGIYNQLLADNQLTTNGQPTDNQLTTNWQPTDNQLTTNWQPTDNQLTTELGKVSIEEFSKGQHNTEQSHSGGGVSEDDFEKFWNAYPKQIKKMEAREAFAKVDVPVERLLEAINAQIKKPDWQKEDGRYIPAPAKWLNERRWEDGENSQSVEAAKKYYETLKGWVEDGG